jgi:signal transduction histidine kinase
MAGRGRLAGAERRQGGRLASARTVAVSDWRELSRGGRIATAGVVASAVLALALGAFIPGVVKRHAIGSSLDSNVSTVRLLEHHMVDVLEGAPAPSYDELDEIIRHELLGGPNLHVMLWDPHGTVIYADRQDLVGTAMPLTADMASALAGQPAGGLRSTRGGSVPPPLGAGGQWLEFFVPVRAAHGEVPAVFQIQQDARPMAAHLRSIQHAVWLSVSSGLAILFVFLSALFAATNRAISRRREAAERRAADLATLLSTAQLVAGQPVLDSTAPLVLERLSGHLGLEGAAIAVPGPDGDLLPRWTAGEVSTACDEVIGRAVESVGDVVGPTDCAPCACVSQAIPLGTGPQRCGVLVVRRRADLPFTEHELGLLRTVAAQIGVAVENTQLFAQLCEAHDLRGSLLQRLVHAQEDERRHLVGELHDGLGQNLTRVLYGLRGTRARLDDAGPDILAELRRLESIVEHQSQGLRRYLGYIAPASLERFGLAGALQSMADEQRIEAALTVHVSVDCAPTLSRDAAITLYRAAQEAVLNVRKHAGTDEVWISLEERDGRVRLVVEDQGRGTGRLDEGVGLTYMRERIESLRGSLAVSSAPGCGTRLVLSLPEAEHVAAAHPAG